MWLLDTATLKLGHFITDIPDYVILSHTWGDGEVGFDDIAQPYAKQMVGYSKISRCCTLAAEAGFEWAWVDTCCIDKRSSAELSEAINSMYRWYWNAAICYAYISDCSTRDDKLTSSRWFTRGWTLQELLAPDVVEFYASDWKFLGTKTSLIDQIVIATKIDKRYLLNRPAIDGATIATKFSWASARETTRKEDMAYCLLGLVQVNMPMLYGEGPGAFYRLQLEIIKQTTDHTIFAWNPFTFPLRQTSMFAFSPAQLPMVASIRHTSMFASSPAQFANVADIRHDVPQGERPSTHEMTNHGLKITIPCITRGAAIVALLNCSDTTGLRSGVYLAPTGTSTYKRPNTPLTKVHPIEAKQATTKTIYIETGSRSLEEPSAHVSVMTVHIMSRSSRISRITNGNFMEIYPDQLDAFGDMQDSDMRQEDSISNIEDQIVHDGEFISFVFMLHDLVGYLFFLGMYGGRPWIHVSPYIPARWAEEVNEKRKLFEAGTGDQPIPGQQNHFTDYLSLPIEGYRRLEALARKTRSEGSVQWNVNISVKDARRQEL